MALIEMKKVTKRYPLGETTVTALHEIDFQIHKGDFMAVWGPSGSGKTSLLNLIGMIDLPSSGEVCLSGEKINDLSDDALSELRNQKVGFIFQNFNLIPVLSALENVMLPLQIRGGDIKAAREKAIERLREVGLGTLLSSRPDQMSGGQRQRVAIARALITDPDIVLADEPTANLDSETSFRIISLMRELNEKNHVTFVFSTHDPRLLDHVNHKIKLVDGKIIKEKG
ncbi:MAG: ABC transporter ATP-binding protein [Nitrospirota bacterium]